MDDKNYSIAQRFLAAAIEGGPATASVIARRAGLSIEQGRREAARLVKKGRLSRVKPALSKGGGYYRYFLSEDQLKHYARIYAIDAVEYHQGMGTVCIIERLNFLRMLNERTVYAGNLTLGVIISDYEKALAEVNKQDKMQ